MVEAWIARELSPAAKAKHWIETGGKALEGLARMVSTPPAPASVVVVQSTDRRVWALVLLAYGAAKLLETNDHAIYELTSHWVSGHSLKHVVASMAAWSCALILAASTGTIFGSSALIPCRSGPQPVMALGPV